MEGLIAKVVNQLLDTLGIQAELSKKNLDINIPRGRVDVSDVSLAGHFLNSLQLPFEVVRVMVDKVTARWSTLRLTSVPIVVEVSGVSLLVRMGNGDHWNMRTCWEAKTRLVSLLEKLIPPASTNPQKKGFKAPPKFVVKIINNLQFSLDTLRVVLVDATDKPVVCGLVLKSLKVVQSPDDDHAKAHHKFEAHKRIVVEGVEAFMDAEPNTLSSRVFLHSKDDPVPLTDKEVRAFLDAVCHPSPKVLLLHPLFFELQFGAAFKPKPLPDGTLPTLPEFTCTANIKSIEVSVSDMQFDAMICVMLHVHHLLVLNYERQWKPVGSPVDSRRQWLEYALFVHLSRNRTKLPVEFANRMGIPTFNPNPLALVGPKSIHKRYISLYLRALEAGKFPMQGNVMQFVETALGLEDAREFQKLERSLSVKQLLVFRQMAVRKAPKKSKAAQTDNLIDNLESALKEPSTTKDLSDSEPDTNQAEDLELERARRASVSRINLRSTSAQSWGDKLEQVPLLLALTCDISNLSLTLSLQKDDTRNNFATIKMEMIRPLLMLLEDTSLFAQASISAFQMFESSPSDANASNLALAFSQPMLHSSFYMFANGPDDSNPAAKNQKKKRRAICSEWLVDVKLSPMEVKLQQTLVERLLDFISVVLVQKDAMKLIWTIRKTMRTPLDVLLPFLTVPKWNVGVDFGGVTFRPCLAATSTHGPAELAMVTVPGLKIVGSESNDILFLEVDRPPTQRRPSSAALNANAKMDSFVTKVKSMLDIWKLRRVALEYFSAIAKKQSEIQERARLENVTSIWEVESSMTNFAHPWSAICHNYFFSSNKVNQRGVIPLEEFRLWLLNRGLRESRVRFIINVWRCLKQTTAEANRVTLQDVFSRMDVDQDGVVERSAFESLLNSVHSSSSHLSFSEFEKAIISSDFSVAKPSLQRTNFSLQIHKPTFTRSRISNASAVTTDSRPSMESTLSHHHQQQQQQPSVSVSSTAPPHAQSAHAVHAQEEECVRLGEFYTLFPLVQASLKADNTRLSLVRRFRLAFRQIDVPNYGQVNLCTVAWALKSLGVVANVRDGLALLQTSSAVNLAKHNTSNNPMATFGSRYLNVHSFSLLFLSGLLPLAAFEKQGATLSCIPMFRPSKEGVKSFHDGISCAIVNSLNVPVAVDGLVTINSERNQLKYVILGKNRKKGRISFCDIQRVELGLAPGLELCDVGPHPLASLCAVSITSKHGVFAFVVRDPIAGQTSLMALFSSVLYYTYLQGKMDSEASPIETNPPSNNIPVGAPLTVRFYVFDVLGEPVRTMDDAPIFLHIVASPTHKAGDQLAEGDCEMVWHQPAEPETGFYEVETRCLETGDFFLALTRGPSRQPITNSRRVHVHPTQEKMFVEYVPKCTLSPIMPEKDHKIEVLLFNNMRQPIDDESLVSEIVGTVTAIRFDQVDLPTLGAVTTATEPVARPKPWTFFRRNPKLMQAFGSNNNIGLTSEPSTTTNTPNSSGQQWSMVRVAAPTKLQFTTSDIARGIFATKFVPAHEGLYMIEVRLKDIPSKDPPIILSARADPTQVAAMLASKAGVFRQQLPRQRLSIGQDLSGIALPVVMLQASDSENESLGNPQDNDNHPDDAAQDAPNDDNNTKDNTQCDDAEDDNKDGSDFAEVTKHIMGLVDKHIVLDTTDPQASLHAVESLIAKLQQDARALRTKSQQKN